MQNGLLRKTCSCIQIAQEVPSWVAVVIWGLGVFLQWPESWAESDILKDITFLEMVPIAIAVMLWRNYFRGLGIQFCTENMACLHILNSKSGKSERVMKLVRAIVLWSLQFDFHINGVHVNSAENFTDAIPCKH